MAVVLPPVEELLFNGFPDPTNQSFDQLRRLIITDGLEQTEDGICSSRLYAWLVLLQTQPIDYEQYAALLERGASPAYQKIQDDVHRTMATDPHFIKRVTKSSLTRVLNTVAWSTHDKLAAETPLPPSPTLEPQQDFDSPQIAPVDGAGESDVRKADLYVQGMNVLAAPLLFVSRSEPAAFSLMRTLLQDQIPTYFEPGLAGVHVAMNLLQEVLALVDPELSMHLPPANTYAMGPIMTLCASIPPLSEVFRLWDFLLAAGPHMVVLCVAGMLIGMRQQLLAERASAVLGRNFGPLDAKRTIDIVRTQVVPVVFQNTELGSRIVSHTRVSSKEQP